MSKNRLKLTNEDLRDVFDFRKYLKMPEKQYYCKIYGIVYADKDGTELFDTKEECIESFMTSPIFEPLWSKLCDIVNDRYGDLLEAANRKGKGKTNAVWYNDPSYMTVHNKLEDCINYYKEVIINRMIRMRVIIFHKTYDTRKRKRTY